MNRRHVVFVVTATLVLLVATAIRFGWFSPGPTLTIYLRCDGQMLGTLSVATVPKKGQPHSDASFDLKSGCEAGKIEFAGYRSEANLQFTFGHRNGKKVELVAEYGRDIQRDQNGFYMVLKVTDAPPFIDNDRI